MLLSTFCCEAIVIVTINFVQPNFSNLHHNQLNIIYLTENYNFYFSKLYVISLNLCNNIYNSLYKNKLFSVLRCLFSYKNYTSSLKYLLHCSYRLRRSSTVFLLKLFIWFWIHLNFNTIPTIFLQVLLIKCSQNKINIFMFILILILFLSMIFANDIILLRENGVEVNLRFDEWRLASEEK